MSELPTGTVTFLFTDIEASTKLLHELGDEYADALDEHRRVLREAFARHGGVEVDTQGDAFFVAFVRVKDALAAAAEGRQAIDGCPVRVRMGLHTGEPVAEQAGTLWGAVEGEAERAPIGQWENEREEYAGYVFTVAGPEFERGRADGRATSLDEAVEYALSLD
jgi:class 3 adenylate cyclase